MEHFYSIWTWSTVYQQRFGRLVKDPGRCAEADERGVPAFKMMNLHFRLHLRHNELELCDVSQLGKITRAYHRRVMLVKTLVPWPTATLRDSIRGDILRKNRFYIII